MIITNYDDLISNARTPAEVNARKNILELLAIGVESVLPRNLIPNVMSLKNGILQIKDIFLNLSDIRNIYIIGAGKASGAMAESVETILKGHISEGIINVPEGTKTQYKTKIIKINESSHPIPSESGIYGSLKMVELLKKVHINDLVIVLISGGGSALMPLPTETISLEELKFLNESLIKSGATIQEINMVRKHCSRIKGGQLAKLGYPATIITLILSDIIGNPFDSIASGPTVPDPTTFKQSIDVLKKYNLWAKVPLSIQNHLQKGKAALIPETPKPGDIVFQRTRNLIIGNIEIACEAIKQAAIAKGIRSFVYSTEISGDAREIGKGIFQMAKKRFKEESGTDINQPVILIAGGETTVAVKGSGRGGRCQEMGLSIIAELPNLQKMTFAAMGTDGIDGFTDAAGIIIDNQTIGLMKQKNLDPLPFLNNNDSYSFFRELQDSLIFTGPTGTNVNDIILVGLF